MGSSKPLPCLMYPYAELGDVQLDGRKPDPFDFRIARSEFPTQKKNVVRCKYPPER